MTARVYDASHWWRARQERARRGKAPRLALRRTIYLRQRPNGKWGAAIGTQRFGVMSAPEWLCREGSLGQAMAAVLIAWRQHRLGAPAPACFPDIRSPASGVILAPGETGDEPVPGFEDLP